MLPFVRRRAVDHRPTTSPVSSRVRRRKLAPGGETSARPVRKNTSRRPARGVKRVFAGKCELRTRTRCRRWPYFASATIVFTLAVTPPPTSISTMKLPVSRIGSSSRIFLLVDLHAAGGLDRLGDLLRGDGAEQLAVLAGLVVDRQHGLGEQGRGLVGAIGGARSSSSARSRRRSRLLQRALGGGLGELARDQVVAQVAGRDVDRVAGLAEPLDVLEQDGLAPSALADVGQQRQLAGALDRQRQLRWWRRESPVTRRERVLPRSEMKRRSSVDVLVVDHLDVDPRVLARATAIAEALAACRGSAPPLLSSLLPCHPAAEW